VLEQQHKTRIDLVEQTTKLQAEKKLLIKEVKSQRNLIAAAAEAAAQPRGVLNSD
jgi:hypothetical protein